MGLSNEELIDCCKRLEIDCDVAISASEGYKKDIDDTANKTWQNVIKILSKDLNKDQTPEQAYNELMATGLISKEVLQNIKAGSAGFDTLDKVENWFNYSIGVSLGSTVTGLGIGAYVKYVAEPGADAARAATAAANRALEALEARAENALARVLGPNVAVEGAQREILLANHELLAAVGQEAAIVERAAFLGRWSSRLFKLGLWGTVAAIGVTIGVNIYEKVAANAAEKDAAEELKHSLHWMYTSRFYMTVQQKYLEFLMQHVSQVEVYTSLLAEGDEKGAATVLKSMTSHAVELDPKTNEVKLEKVKPYSWTDEAVAAELAKHDQDKGRKTDDDPTKEQREKIHEEQLRKIEEHLKEEKARAAAAAAAKPN